jgi:hypothetical protein
MVYELQLDPPSIALLKLSNVTGIPPYSSQVKQREENRGKKRKKEREKNK